MYKVQYQKLAVMPDGKIGNISQGGDIAYIECDLEKVEERVNQYLCRDGEKKHVAVIDNVERIKGHLVI